MDHESKEVQTSSPKEEKKPTVQKYKKAMGIKFEDYSEADKSRKGMEATIDKHSQKVKVRRREDGFEVVLYDRVKPEGA